MPKQPWLTGSALREMHDAGYFAKALAVCVDTPADKWDEKREKIKAILVHAGVALEQQQRLRDEREQLLELIRELAIICESFESRITVDESDNVEKARVCLEAQTH